MPLNIFDLDNVQMNGMRKSDRMAQRILSRFYGPEYETAAGKLWAEVKQDPETLNALRKKTPGAVKDMEVRYAKS